MGSLNGGFMAVDNDNLEALKLLVNSLWEILARACSYHDLDVLGSATAGLEPLSVPNLKFNPISVVPFLELEPLTLPDLEVVPSPEVEPLPLPLPVLETVLLHELEALPLPESDASLFPELEAATLPAFVALLFVS